MVLSDATSQLIIVVYSVYTILYKIIYNFITKITQPFNYTTSFTEVNNQLNTTPFNIHNHVTTTPNVTLQLFNNITKPTPLLAISKSLSQLNLYLNHFELFMPSPKHKVYNVTNKPNYVTLVLNSRSVSGITTQITSSETFYLPSLNDISMKTNSVSINLSELYNMYKSRSYKSQFNFNLESNLNISNQQRWLSKNSLLSESIIHNSFRITQAKKLIGAGTLNPNYTSQSLWLPTQASKLSTLETSLYLNNLSPNFNKLTKNINFVNTHQHVQPSFTNLNFFENSRLFLLKKYFFTNNQNQNMVINSYKNSTSFTKQSIFNTNMSVNSATNSLLQLSSNPLTPSLSSNYVNSLDTTVRQANNSVGMNLVALSTPTLNLLSGPNLQFIFLLTSNFNEYNTTNYFNYLNYPTGAVNISNISKNIKFTS